MFVDFREREEGTEKHQYETETSMWERNTDWLPPVSASAGDWTRNLGICLDQGSNPQPFGAQDDTPTNWAPWPGQPSNFSSYNVILKFYLLHF